MASTLIQSDKSISGDLNKSKIVSRKKGHRDLDLKLGIHPVRKDLNVLKDALMSDTLVVNCSNANLKYFGIPLSIYNSFFSLMFLIVIVFNAYKEKNQKA